MPPSCAAAPRAQSAGAQRQVGGQHRQPHAAAVRGQAQQQRAGDPHQVEGQRRRGAVGGPVALGDHQGRQPVQQQVHDQEGQQAGGPEQQGRSGAAAGEQRHGEAPLGPGGTRRSGFRGAKGRSAAPPAGAGPPPTRKSVRQPTSSPTARASRDTQTPPAGMPHIIELVTKLRRCGLLISAAMAIRLGRAPPNPRPVANRAASSGSRPPAKAVARGEDPEDQGPRASSTGLRPPAIRRPAAGEGADHQPDHGRAAPPSRPAPD